MAMTSLIPTGNTFKLTINPVGLAAGAVVGSLVYTTVSSSGKTAADITESGLHLVEKVISIGVRVVAGSIAERIADQIGDHVIRKIGDGIRTTATVSAIASGTIAVAGTSLVITISGYFLTRMATGTVYLSKAAYCQIMAAMRSKKDLSAGIDVTVTGNDVYIQALDDYVMINPEDLPPTPDITAGWD